LGATTWVREEEEEEEEDMAWTDACTIFLARLLMALAPLRGEEVEEGEEEEGEEEDCCCCWVGLHVPSKSDATLSKFSSPRTRRIRGLRSIGMTNGLSGRNIPPPLLLLLLLLLLPPTRGEKHASSFRSSSSSSSVLAS